MAQPQELPTPNRQSPPPPHQHQPQQQTCPSYWNASVPRVEDVDRYRTLSAPHVESFDYFLDHGLNAGVQSLEPHEIDLLDPKRLISAVTGEPLDIGGSGGNGDAGTGSGGLVYPAETLDELSRVRVWFENASVQKPTKDSQAGRSPQLRPNECRERRLVYAGALEATVCIQIIDRRNGMDMPGKVQKLVRSFGELPIMVMSKQCHLRGLSPTELMQCKEEDTEFGGYFIVKGNERVIRMLQIPRRNYPTAIQRGSYQNRGSLYTDKGVSIRSVSSTFSSRTITLHYLTTGTANVKFVCRKQEFLIPVILIVRALGGGSIGKFGVTDQEIYHRIVAGDETDTFLVARARLLVQDARSRFPDCNTPEECLAYIGMRLRRVLKTSECMSNAEVGEKVLRTYILIHLDDTHDKLECLFLMLRKLYLFAAGKIGEDNADSLQNQEILLPGHLVAAFIKEKFEEVQLKLAENVQKMLYQDYDDTCVNIRKSTTWPGLIDRASLKSTGSIGKKLEYFLSTGNLVSISGLDLMQVSGYTIVAERINFLRYCSHYRSVHRGSFFMELRTTAVRKLLPDQWGFICPVHTPDGAPCGLLSHLALKCQARAYPCDDADHVEAVLFSLGMSPQTTHVLLPVCMDGRVLGGANAKQCVSIASKLRLMKVEGTVPETMEVALIPPGDPGSPFPGLFLFTREGRLVRPVLQRVSSKIEWIGPLEQNFMDIACLDEDIRDGITTHQELDPMNMLSLIASMTPFSDQNQSPRNMYQCQMGKQTMGTPYHSLLYRTDNKMYRLQTPQAPIVQTNVHGRYKMDNYPNGANAVVAVLSYTGYDMEDAMILNMSSVERGFGHASVYKTKVIDLKEEINNAGASKSVEVVRMKLGNKTDRFGDIKYPNLDDDGLPPVGERLEYDDPLYCLVDSVNDWDKIDKHKERETAYVQAVRAIGNDSGKANENLVSMTLRFPRNPVIGDKFSSRHGQKGVLSILWPQENMPFTESGISPDLIINPHAFPSRMTIGMLVESMAGKSGAMHGTFQDASPFQFHESGDKVSVDYFGEQLLAAGYNYYGSEPLYSGSSGCILEADLYIGVVYYQRLRHMVSDKYQVRATGPVNELTRQPIKGRKMGGGIRFGEMERDSLLSHGTSFLLQDRLMNSSDRHVTFACSRCGDLLMPTTERCAVRTTSQSADDAAAKPKMRLFCRSPQCLAATRHQPEGNDVAVEPIALPFVYRYLVNELAGMNIKVKLEIG